MDNAALRRLFDAANKLATGAATIQVHEEKNLSLTVCSIKHYILDASSSTILKNASIPEGTQITPFDGYDLLVSDGRLKTVVALAEPQLSRLIQKRLLEVGTVITKIAVRICFSERMSRHRIILATDLSLDPSRKMKISFDQLCWLPDLDPVHFQQPQLSQRENSLSIWNITDPVGACWECSLTSISRISDSRQLQQCRSLTQAVADQCGKNQLPLLVRVLTKSRLNYFTNSRGKRLDMRTCPYQFDVLVADDRSCCLAVFWNEIAVRAYRSIDIGSYLLIRSYRFKQAHKQPGYSACCFSSSLERYNLEIAISDRTVGGKLPFDIVEPQALPLMASLPSVPFNFIPISLLSSSASALDNINLDFAGVILYAGRWNRESRRYFRSLQEVDEGAVGASEGLLVSSISGETFYEEFNSGGFWMWRWLVLCDESSNSVIRVKLYGTSQPDVQYKLYPGQAIVVTQLRFLVLNKMEANDSRFQPKFVLTTTNESQIVPLAELDYESPFSREDRAVRVMDFADELSAEQLSILSFGGAYDFPGYPETFENLLKSFKRQNDDAHSKEPSGLVYMAAPQFESFVESMSFMEQRSLVVHALLASVCFVGADEILAQASSHVGTDSGRSLNSVLSPKRRRVDNRPSFSLASSWEERRAGFRGLGVEWPHWRSIIWHWQNKSADELLRYCINPPVDLAPYDPDAAEPRLHLNALAHCAGYLQVQLLLLNHSIYVNCLVPVPERCCTDSILSLHAQADQPGDSLISLINSCCDCSDVFGDPARQVHGVQKKPDIDKINRSMRQFFGELKATPQSKVTLPACKTSAILHCYGLVGNAVEIGLKHLYPRS